MELTRSKITPIPGRGLRVLVRRSKTDQCGIGQEIAVWAKPKEPGFYPLAALKAWLVFRRKGSDIKGGASDGERPISVGMSKAGRLTGQALSDKAVLRLVKGAADAAGADLAQVMRQTRHRSADVAPTLQTSSVTTRLSASGAGRMRWRSRRGDCPRAIADLGGRHRAEWDGPWIFDGSLPPLPSCRNAATNASMTAARADPAGPGARSIHTAQGGGA